MVYIVSQTNLLIEHSIRGSSPEVSKPMMMDDRNIHIGDKYIIKQNINILYQGE